MIPQRLIIIGARRWWLEGEEGRSRDVRKMGEGS